MSLILLLLSGTALANGQTTHLWITETARTHLPAGELADLLTGQSDVLRVGTMFPDGGYAIGHDYGEVAHWEPFQGLLRDWILDNFDDPAGTDAAPYVAFYLGLASHGMADQVFDSMYMERSRVYDAEYGWSQEEGSLDTSQDIVFAALTQGQPVPERWLPDILPTLFEEAGIEVDAQTIEDGQSWLEFAVDSVTALSGSDDMVEDQADAFPWGCSHLLDEAVPGAPPMEARIVARYWQALWDELLGEPVDLEVIGQFPDEGTTGHTATVGDVEARLSVVFNRGLYSDVVTSEVLGVESGGESVEVDLDLFYRDHSHVVNIAPTGGWVPDATHTLRITPDLHATDDRQLADDFTLTFSTAVDRAEADDARACGCASGGTNRAVPGWWIGLCVLAWRRRR
ncbi:MAG: hypothetical protein QGG40_01205 [Myxococcota bacterium]|jgi:hypothetical protein|nr:hypothetical protein [Myxococcota bacterium]